MTVTAELRKSPLNDWHAAAGGKFVDFHGWSLPVQYTGIVDEHKATRQAAGLFDISHMGQVMVEGAGAFDYLQHLTTNNLSRTWEKSLGTYAHLCRPDGGVIDDIFVYGIRSAKRFLVIVNGATHEKDVAWMRQNVTKDVTITDLHNRGGFAIQGPHALAIIRDTIAGIAELPRFAYQQIVGGDPQDTFWGCRTGYSGEDGAEFFGPAKTIVTLWKQLMENGQGRGLKACGLGARDTLRTEMGYPLYGHELTEQRTPLEAGLDWVVKWDKGDFIGRAALARQKEAGLRERLIGFILKDRGVPRPGIVLRQTNGSLDEKAVAVSATFSPSLQTGIGLAYAPVSWPAAGAELVADINGRSVAAESAALPFYHRPQS